MRPLLLLDREIMMCVLELQGLIGSDAAVPNSYVSAIIRRARPELEALRSACQDSDKSLRTLAYAFITEMITSEIDPSKRELSPPEFSACNRMMVKLSSACTNYVERPDATEPQYYPGVKNAITRARDAINELYLKSDEPTRRTTHAVQTTLIAIGSALKFNAPTKFPFQNLNAVGKALADQFDTVEDVRRKSR